MVRKLRYRQAIREGTYAGGNLEGVPYKKAVRMYKALVKPETGTPTIPQARVMHTTLGTWDDTVTWSRWTFPCGHVENQLHFEKLRKKGTLMYYIFPKAMYKNLYPLTKGAKVLGGNQ
ncbi:hypothetical protein [Bacillus cereus]|uniref:hypothetical protein n=1 Tax=Bacillus cereus TaxID=1396 RepID=UPI0011A9DC04|nr:hypothetical protein [Bacillus cereus]